MKRPAGLNIRIQIVILVIILAVIGTALYLFSTTIKTSGTKSVTFQVQATGGYASVTWKAGSNHIDNATTVTTPWERTVYIEPGTQVIITVANPSNSGTVGCKILIERQAWKSSSAKAPQSGVACGGIVP